jgi:hypothetical protein
VSKQSLATFDILKALVFGPPHEGRMDEIRQAVLGHEAALRTTWWTKIKSKLLTE